VKNTGKTASDVIVRIQESAENLDFRCNGTPSDKYFGRDQEILEQRRRLNQTMALMELIS
jgi:hypothetical protein